MFGNESSPLKSLTGTKVPGNEGCWERTFQGMKVPSNESSTYGNFVPGNESSFVQKFQLPPCNRRLHIIILFVYCTTLTYCKLILLYKKDWITEKRVKMT